MPCPSCIIREIIREMVGPPIIDFFADFFGCPMCKRIEEILGR